MSWIDDLIPSVCLGCMGYVKAGLLCDKCKKDLARFNHPLNIKDSRIGKKNFLDALYYVWSYNSVAGSLVRRFKFQGDFLCWHVLKLELKIFWERYLSYFKGSGVVLTYVPMPWPKKYLIRGFDQAEIIARWSSAYLKLPFYKLIYARLHLPQHWFRTKKIRTKSISNVFIANVKLIDNLIAKGYNKVIIIDDIVSSAATLEEAAKTIKSHGIDTMIGFTLCG